MFEFVELQPKSAFEFSWEERAPVKIDKPMSFKQLLKKISNDDTGYYQSFYEPSRCESLFLKVAAFADIKWMARKSEAGVLSLEEFVSTYIEYQETMAHGANDMGITMSWFRCYDYLKDGHHSTCLNSFGIDSKKVLSQTVPGDADVMHV